MNKKAIILTVISTIIANGSLYAEESKQEKEVEKVLVEKNIKSDKELVLEILANLTKIKAEITREQNEGEQRCESMWSCLQTMNKDLENIEDDEIFKIERQKVIAQLLQTNILDLKVENEELKVILSDEFIDKLKDEGIIVSAETQGGGTMCF